MKYLNKSFLVCLNQSKKYAKGYVNINWNYIDKCKDCGSEVALLGLLKNGKEQWLCTKCNRVYQKDLK